MTNGSITFNKSIAAGATFWLMLITLAFGRSALSQPALNAENMSLGGGGTAYLDGPAATFGNPANLFIRDRPGRFHLDIGQSAFRFEPLESHTSLNRQFEDFLDGYQPYTQVAAGISNQQRRAILRTHFPGNKLQDQNKQRADVILAGAVWQRKDYALSVALRARYSSRVGIGRGWYDQGFLEHNNRQVRDFSLTQHRSELYEIAVGYAQEFTFINGFMPGLNTLYVGIAPKIILAGPAFEASYNARYIRDGGQTIRNKFISSFNMRSSGSFSGTTTDYLQSRNPREAIRDNIGDNYQFEHTGYGIGFDFGLNYVIPLSMKKEYPVNQSAPARVGKSLRIGFSLNDIGAIRYHSQPLSMSSPVDSSQAGLQMPVSTMFLGSAGQYIHFLHSATSLPNPLQNADQQSDQPYSALLPTSINTGMMLDLDRFKVMGDLTLGLNNTAFTTTNLSVHIGAEIRPVRYIPIRIGTRFSREELFHMGLGTGIETTSWDFTIGARTLFLRESPQASLVGGAFGGLQFHF